MIQRYILLCLLVTWLFAIGFCTTSSVFAQSQQVTLNPSKDNTLFEDDNGSLSSGAGPGLFVGRIGPNGGGKIRRGLIRFDIAGNIPSNAEILSVVLTMHVSRTVSGAQTIELRRALADWGEGTSISGGGSGAPATTGDATWLHKFFNTQFWSNQGGDFSSTMSASQSVAGVGTYTWESTLQMVSDVQNWLGSPSTNFGWVLIGNENDLQSVKEFDSREGPFPTDRPQLTVTYTPGLSVENDVHTPYAFSLKQNYPNPFNPETEIGFQIPVSGYVTLKVYDVLGREVASLIDGTRGAGDGKVRWNASSVPSGVYFYQLRAGASMATSKLIISK
jgi:hypothetical protein